MPDQKISADTTVTPAGADFVPIIQGGANRKSTVASFPISTATQTALDTKQATLVSGTNIKTINSTSILGSGDIVIAGVGDMLKSENLSGLANYTTARSNLGLGSAAITASTDYAPALTADENYVTDAQLVVITNTSGTNTGDSATNSTSNTYADGKVSDTAYNAGTWDAVTTIAPSKNAIRDKIDAMDTAIGLNTAKVTNATHSGDATGATVLTLATVNANVGSFTNANVTVNAKGLVTAASNGSSSSTGYTTTATAGGTTTLTSSSTYYQYFTGTLQQTITLPVTSILTTGHSFYFTNKSTNTIDINSSGGNNIVTLASGTSCLLICILTTGTTSASWNFKYDGLTTATKLTGTADTTMTFPSTSATIARTDAAQTFTGAQTFSSTIVGSVNGNAATVTTNANLTGHVTSTGNAAVLGSFTKAQLNTAVSDGDVAYTDVATLSSLSSVGTITTGTWNATDIAVADGGTGRSTGTTAYALIATGTTATGAQQTLANGATTEVLVGGGASALPVWSTATGSGAPVRATSPTLVTPVLGTPSSGNLSSCTEAIAYGLKSATTTVSVSAATAPTSGQVLTATSGTAATWQTAGGGGFVELKLQDYSGPGFIGILGQYDASRAGTLVEVTIIADTLPVGSNLIGELRKNSTTSGNVLSTTLQVTTTESVTNGRYIGATPVTTFSSSAIADGDVFYVYLTGVGSTTAALNPRIILRYT